LGAIAPTPLNSYTPKPPHLTSVAGLVNTVQLRHIFVERLLADALVNSNIWSSNIDKIAGGLGIRKGGMEWLMMNV
jgi:hypothetical protein